MTQRICAHPDCEKPAAHGLRKPGLRSEQVKPDSYLWTCAEHEEWALARREKATGAKHVA